MLFAAKHARLVTALLMSIYMVTIMTFVITWVNTGIDADFLSRWWRAFYIAWPIAFSLILLGGPLMQKAASKLIRR